MTAPGAGADPIDAHIADLTAALHGPVRAKSRMVTELREGLIDAARDLSSGREPDHHAARQAVREFGTVAEIVPSFQRELTIAQARHTARRVMLIVPLLLVCWYMAQTWDGSTGHRPPGPIQLLVAHLGGVAASASFLAAAALAATGALARRLPTPDQLPIMVAWTGTTAAAALAISAIALTLASVLATNWPLSLLAGLVTIVFHAKIAASARACRECASLSLAGP
ncbi:permease prefix domain 1-containing protein [Streptomyces sp. NBC_01591]|uniref:permease prefix domain 1-containing protein n=1 Tax=Streptomyces sp. NBC_01591 TaxID=2975888 RepID=UPI002DD8C6BF|nr:permease prefix domain 1-containing protein [Streptomyces sp. NBC_01591]WSD69718.1 permease prefix domain 1-containing protein [Streptomyces sp. NBC_01591]